MWCSSRQYSRPPIIYIIITRRSSVLLYRMLCRRSKLFVSFNLHDSLRIVQEMNEDLLQVPTRASEIGYYWVQTRQKYLPSNGLKMLVNSLVISRLDYCNSLLYDIPKYQRDKLQRIQNTAARMITGARSSDHITPLLKSLHWLPVEARIAPWGTPDLTEDHEEVVARTTTRCCRFDKKFLNQCNRLPSIP